VTRGLLNLTHRDSREHPSPLVPGPDYRVEIELEVTSWVFETGHRIRLDLAGTDWPNAWSPPQPVTLAIERTGSALILPTVPGPAPFAGRPRLSPPSRSKERFESPKGNVSSNVIWRIEHDVLGRETRAVTAYGGPNEGDDARPPFTDRYEGTVAVSTVDPGAARAEGRAAYEIAWPEATVRTEVRQLVTSDAEAYHLQLELDVAENGEPRWSRRWERRFPRQLQ
jgi:hypothetical protein